MQFRVATMPGKVSSEVSFTITRDDNGSSEHVTLARSELQSWSNCYSAIHEERIQGRDVSNKLLILGKKINQTFFGNGLTFALDDGPVQLIIAGNEDRPFAEQGLDLPWEILGFDRFFAELPDAAFSVIRRVSDQASTPTHAPAIAVYQNADPGDKEDLDFEAEEFAVARALDAGGISVEFEDTGRLDGLEQHWSRLPNGFRILHSSCHGEVRSGTPVILLENRFGGEDPIAAEAYLEAFGDKVPDILFQSNCLTGKTGRRVQKDGTFGSYTPSFVEQCAKVVSVAIGFEFSVSQEDATELAKQFYAGLTEGQRPSVAMALARREVLKKNSFADWDLARLYIHDGCDVSIPSGAATSPLQMQAKFFGRRREIRAALRAFRKGQVVEVSGLPGSGKTAFAKHVAERLGHHAMIPSTALADDLAFKEALQSNSIPLGDGSSLEQWLSSFEGTLIIDDLPSDLLDPTHGNLNRLLNDLVAASKAHAHRFRLIITTRRRRPRAGAQGSEQLTLFEMSENAVRRLIEATTKVDDPWADAAILYQLGIAFPHLVKAALEDQRKSGRALSDIVNDPDPPGALSQTFNNLSKWIESQIKDSDPEVLGYITEPFAILDIAPAPPFVGSYRHNLDLRIPLSSVKAACYDLNPEVRVMELAALGLLTQSDGILKAPILTRHFATPLDTTQRKNAATKMLPLVLKAWSDREGHIASKADRYRAFAIALHSDNCGKEFATAMREELYFRRREAANQNATADIAEYALSEIEPDLHMGFLVGLFGLAARSAPVADKIFAQLDGYVKDHASIPFQGDDLKKFRQLLERRARQIRDGGDTEAAIDYYESFRSAFEADGEAVTLAYFEIGRFELEQSANKSEKPDRDAVCLEIRHRIRTVLPLMWENKTERVKTLAAIAKLLDQIEEHKRAFRLRTGIVPVFKKLEEEANKKGQAAGQSASKLSREIAFTYGALADHHDRNGAYEAAIEIREEQVRPREDQTGSSRSIFVTKSRIITSKAKAGLIDDPAKERRKLLHDCQFLLDPIQIAKANEDIGDDFKSANAYSAAIDAYETARNLFRHIGKENDAQRLEGQIAELNSLIHHDVESP